MGVLDQILARKREELPELRARRLPPRPTQVPAFDLRRNGTEGLRLLCEIKRRSPSAGQLSTTLSVAERARAYEEAGAAAISVLCDETFFDGAFEHLEQARMGTKLPLLCKEFIIDECQLDAAAAYGASAALLIVRILDDATLHRLIRETSARHMVPLVEVFTHEESVRALDAGADFIGVNARDLDTLVMDGERAASIVESLPPSVCAAHLSGVKSPEDVQRVAIGRADAALIGEVLMRQDDPRETLTSLVRATQARVG